MISRITAGWQLILADLALILFLVTLAALASATKQNGINTHGQNEITGSPETLSPAIAPVQALYRPAPDIKAFDLWLAEHPHDPRAQLTIIASHTQAGEAEMWQTVRAMAADAAQQNIAAKVIMTAGPRDDVYASFAFDAHPKSANQ